MYAKLLNTYLPSSSLRLFLSIDKDITGKDINGTEKVWPNNITTVVMRVVQITICFWVDVLCTNLSQSSTWTSTRRLLDPIYAHDGWETSFSKNNCQRTDLVASIIKRHFNAYLRSTF